MEGEEKSVLAVTLNILLYMSFSIDEKSLAIVLRTNLIIFITVLASIIYLRRNESENGLPVTKP